jgi:hypothetical protein
LSSTVYVSEAPTGTLEYTGFPELMRAMNHLQPLAITVAAVGLIGRILTLLGRRVAAGEAEQARAVAGAE